MKHMTHTLNNVLPRHVAAIMLQPALSSRIFFNVKLQEMYADYLFKYEHDEIRRNSAISFIVRALNGNT